MAALSMDRVAKAFGGTAAVRAVTLDIASGEFFALLGPSGCGKTTLLRIIAGFEQPDNGTVRLEGNDITHLPPGERAIGMVFQNYALFPHLTLFENVAFGLRARSVPATEIRKRVEEALNRVALSGKGLRRVTELSGGEQQRVAVARALVLRPRVLLFDEPLSNLDVALRATTREEIRSLQRSTGVTTVYVTHDQTEAMSLADRIAVMRDGSVEQVGPPSLLYDAPASPFVAAFLGGANILQGRLDGDLFTAAGFSLRVLPAAGRQGSGPAILAVKPEAIALNSAGSGSEGMTARVVAREHLGFTTAFRLDAGGVTLKALALSAEAAGGPRPGATIRIVIDPQRCSLFPETP